MKNFLGQLTKKYSLSKTLRFELIPINETREFLKKNKVFEKDTIIDKAYQQAKFYFDEVHRELIKNALSSERIKSLREGFRNFSDIFEKNLEIVRGFQVREKTRIQPQKEIQNTRENLYKLIAEFFVKEDEKLEEKYSSDGKTDRNAKEPKFILSKNVISVLEKKFPKERNQDFVQRGWPSLLIKDGSNFGKEIYIFEKFKGFTTYLAKFQETRKNLYKSNGSSTAVATRIVENFEKFLQNKLTFKKKYKDYISQIREFFEKNYSSSTKEKNFDSLIEVFDLDYYISCLLQDGINKYNRKIGELNKVTKEFRDREKIKKSQLPLFRILDKQILGEIEKQKELIEGTNKKNEEEIFYDRFKEFIEKNEKRFHVLKNLMRKINQGEFKDEYQSIYLNRTAINTISRKWLINGYEFIQKLPHTKDKEGGIKVKKLVSLLDIKKAIEELGKNTTQLFKDKYYREYLEKKETPTEEEKFFAVLFLGNDKDYWQQFLDVWHKEFEALFKLDRKFGKQDKDALISYEKSLRDAKNLQSFSKESKKDRAIVKDYSDAALKIFQMSKYFLLSAKNKKEAPFLLSQEFYADYDEYYQNFDFIRYYNAFRNYITKKPYSEDKIKLNFETGSLLKGWNIGKEHDYLGLIFLRDKKYFLGILKKDKAEVFDFYDNKNDSKKEKERKAILREEAFAKETDDYYLKMNYDQVADASKDIHNLVLMPDGSVQRFTKKEKKSKFWPEYIKEIKDRESYKVGESFDRDDLIKFIDYFRKCAENYWSKFNLRLKNPAEYRNLKEFTDDIDSQAYRITFEKIKKEFVDKNISSGNLYLFQIYSKDFSEHTKGKKNIHTLFFEEIFSQKNALRGYPIRLNGQAEVFFRPESKIKEKIPERLKEKKRNNEQVYEFNRYLNDKILFHCPITLNAICGSISKKEMNNDVNFLIKKDTGQDINIIGIDRGEKNLLYYVVINQEEEILDFGSLNIIDEVNYFTKLIRKEVERQKNRQSWQPIAKIKDLKKGYLSYVVHKISKLVEKYNAIVVLEDLNFRFKQIRGGIERTIYQQFEKALIDKLSYLIFKDKRNLETPGGILNGYQLVAPFDSFQKIGKQTGILFYTDAEYTSKTDPLTGFKKNVYISNSASQESIIDFVKKCREIGWDEKEQSYYFVYNPAKFNKKAFSYEWTVYSKVSRIRREKNDDGHWYAQLVDLNEKFESLFRLWNFENLKAKNLKKEILKKYENNELRGKKLFDKKERGFFQSFIYLFNLILQSRNTLSLQIKKDEEGKVVEVDGGVDFFASPVKPFFRTLAIRKKYNEKGEIIKKEIFQGIKKNFANFEVKFKDKSNIDNFDSDGIGAYNIARKGLMMLKEIEKNPEKPYLFIKKTDWDNFVLKRSDNK